MESYSGSAGNNKSASAEKFNGLKKSILNTTFGLGNMCAGYPGVLYSCTITSRVISIAGIHLVSET